MKPLIVDPDPAYAPPEFLPPPRWGYLHVGASVAPPVGPPFVRRSRRRAALLARLKPLASELEQLPAVRRVTVYRAVLVPPLGRDVRRPARYDVAVLIETDSPEALDDVYAAEAYRRLLAAVTGRPRRCT